jgi:hypothetical protein
MKRKQSHKSKPARRRRQVVRGPQGDLFAGRTPRMRFIEKPVKVKGNPFFAVRVPRELLAAFRKYAGKKKQHPNALVREYMSKVTGMGVGDADE